MIKSIIFALAALSPLGAVADTYVNPYLRKDGTYVEGHRRTSPDANPYNNYSTQGNVNPYTGSQGTVNPYQGYVPPPPPPGRGSAYGPIQGPCQSTYGCR